MNTKNELELLNESYLKNSKVNLNTCEKKKIIDTLYKLGEVAYSIG